ncbi:glucosamine-6-phosphate deaminase [Candidatus Pacearchaeota archaeon CG10_big_fil_rev_8_21_14_0_10_30_48]|nr:MAG: glucosamine-6-phosphate deaminase [Candidatus Pacearchaeota archaeon CG10_big_fil_rev_8_21_14_0_10_30_48]
MSVEEQFTFLEVTKAEEVAKLAAKIVANNIKENPKIVLGLATGNTMISFYRELVKYYKKGFISFSRVKTFNLDEYYGLDSKSKTSFRNFMNKNLFDKVDIKEKNINFLDGDVKNFEKECKRYENKIKEVGGINLQILGIGVNGHIGFNEPGSSFTSVTRKVKLSQSTQKVNAKEFRGKEIPKYALTMGIKTILSANKTILLAIGGEKARIIKKTLEGKITKKVPASVLRKHKNILIIIDCKAGE